ncbi:hypothetical protein M422DRAFT_265340, partial [Sphaerobolus stellatus SS14]
MPVPAGFSPCPIDPSIPLPPPEHLPLDLSPSFRPFPLPPPPPALAHPEYAPFLQHVPPPPAMPVPYTFGLPTPALPPASFFPQPAPMPAPVSTPKAPSKRRPKTKKARAAAAPYSRSLPSPSPSSSSSILILPASGSGADRIHYLLTTLTPENEGEFNPHSKYGVHPTHPYMWYNVQADRVVSEDGNYDGDYSSSSGKNSRGQPATFILERHGGLEHAMSRLATSKEDRRNATKELKNKNDSRPTLDKRQDFYCFMHGCGQCFQRSDRLARHMVGNKRHRGTK